MGFLNDCWKDIFNVLAALGSIGTFGAFILLFIKDKEKQKQIDMLVKIAEVDEKRLKYQAAPMLWLNGASSLPLENLIKIDLNNKGKRANLYKYQVLQGDIELPNTYLPYQLEQGQECLIFVRTLVAPAKQNQIEYKIEVHYEDDVGTKYLSIIRGTGPEVKLISTMEL